MSSAFEKVKITKRGDDLYLPLPKDIAKMLEVTDGDELEVIGSEQAIVYKKVGDVRPIIIKK